MNHIPNKENATPVWNYIMFSRSLRFYVLGEYIVNFVISFLSPL